MPALAPSALRAKLGAAGNGMVTHPWLVVIILGLVALAYWGYSTRANDHIVKAEFPTAFNYVPGLDVQVKGIDAGKLGEVTYVDGKTIVELGIDDEYWPLHVGTTARQRWGTTIGSGTRKIDLELGPKSAPELKENGIIESKYTLPVNDVDQVLNTLRKKTRAQLKTMQQNLDVGLTGHDKQLNAALRDAPGGVQAAGGVVSDLADDTFALNALVVNTDRLTTTLAARRFDLSGLITVVSQTLDEFASNTSGVARSIDEVAPTLRKARGTLRRVDRSVGVLDGLVADIAPGARQLPPLASAAQPALRELRGTVPPALATVRTATRAAPRITRLLSKATPFVRDVGDISGKVAPMAACVRPYAPEAAGVLVSLGSWGSTFILTDPTPPRSEAQGLPKKYTQRTRGGKAMAGGLRAAPQLSSTSLHAFPGSGVTNSEEFVAASRKGYAFPRPPGLGVQEPQFNADCAYGRDSLDPSKDPEQGGGPGKEQGG